MPADRNTDAVPFLQTDVHALDGLAEIARHLFPR
jgi:hypothetical protein